MKNINVLPATDKTTRLFLFVGDLILEKFSALDPRRGRHIYITSDDIITFDEEIKEGDYNVPSDFSNISDISKTSKEDLEVVNDKDNGYKKIILTTDQDLIKDGVQPINDEFLEWFIKNPTSEYTEVVSEIKYFDRHGFCISLMTEDTDYEKKIYYIVPKEI